VARRVTIRAKSLVCISNFQYSSSVVDTIGAWDDMQVFEIGKRPSGMTFVLTNLRDSNRGFDELESLVSRLLAKNFLPKGTTTRRADDCTFIVMIPATSKLDKALNTLVQNMTRRLAKLPARTTMPQKTYDRIQRLIQR
jgi:hypothetical protein